MKRLLMAGPICLLIGALLSGFASVPPQASRILDDSRAKFESLQDLSARFRYEISNPNPDMRAVAREGSLKFKQGKYVLDLGDQVIFCDRQTLWIYLPYDKEVMITPYDPDAGINVESIFSIYQSNSDARYDGTATVHGQACHKVFLALKNPTQDYHQAYLWINKETLLPEKIALIDRKQTKTTYEFLDLTINAGLDDAAFRFDSGSHPEVEIYDER
jgi:outer membrane lipoprotein-sorting protein